MHDLFANLAILPLPMAVLLLLGILFWSWRTFSFLLVFIATGSLIGFSLPIVSRALEGPLVDAAVPYNPGEELGAAVILVPTGGSYYDPDAVLWPTSATVRRAIAARNLQAATGLPVVLIGGAPMGEHEPEALVVTRHVQFAPDNLVVETGPVNTAETARVGSEIIFEMEANQAILVTSPAHVARMAGSLRARGIDVRAAPVRIPEPPGAADAASPMADFLPSARGFADSRAAMREYAAIVYYLFKGELETSDLMIGS